MNDKLSQPSLSKSHEQPRRKHTYKYFLVILSFILLITGALFLSQKLWHDPTCDYWHPNMSKEEKINAALKVANNLDGLQFEFPNGHKEVWRQIPYENIHEILVKNPDCCSLSPADNKLPSDEGVVRLHYLAKPNDKALENQLFYTTVNLDFNHCKRQ